MPRKRNNPVILTEDDRGGLQALIARGGAPARQLTHARILLKADEGGEDAPGEAWPDTKIADAPESAARRSLGCADDPSRRGWKPPSSIALHGEPSRANSMVPRRRI